MKFATYLSSRSLKHDVFAEQIGVSQVAVTRYANGQRIPRGAIMKKIVEATGGEVSPSDFYFDDAEAAE